MKTIRFCLALTVTVCLNFSNAFGESIHVGDTIWQHTTWNADTVLVDTNIIVMPGATLSIEPGTRVEFQGFYMLGILGSLRAIGTPADSIIFTTCDSTLIEDRNTTLGGWRGLYFATDDTSWLHCCKISYTKRVYNDDGPVNSETIRTSGDIVLNISNSHFYRNDKNVIRNGTYSVLKIDSCLFERIFGLCVNSYSGKTIIRNNVFRYNSYHNCIRTGDGLVSGNHIHNNEGLGINVSQAAYVVIMNNLIVNNDGGGIYIYQSNPIIANNTICNNLGLRGGGISVTQNSNPELIANIIWNNKASEYGDQLYIESFSKTNIRNCLLEGGLDSIDYGDGSYYKGEYWDNIDVDPAFVNPASGIGMGYESDIGHWALTDTSPCINKGIITGGYSLPNTDMLQTPRICHGYVDMGTLEYHRETIEAGGNIDTDIEWIADTVKVIANITMDKDRILSIAPGTYIEFQGYFFLECEGGIRAIGKKTDSIVFTARDTAIGWQGIQYTLFGSQEGQDTSIFRYVRFSLVREDFSGMGIRFLNIPYVEITNCIFEDNILVNLLAFHVSSGKISHCTFRNNRGSGFNLLLASYQDLLVTHCLIYNNYDLKDKSGTLIYCDNASLDVRHTGIFNNDIWRCIATSKAKDLNISNTIIANNMVNNVLAGFSFSGNVSIMNSTITRNDTYNGNYIYLEGNNPYCRFLMANSILHGNPWGNNSISDAIYLYRYVNTELVNNIIQGGLDSIYVDTEDVQLVYLDNLDTIPHFLGPTPGSGPDFDALNADWGLSIFSPCLDRGISDYPDVPVAEVDYLGNPRVVNGEVDLGAIEKQSESLIITSQPDNLFLCEGDTAYFNVTASDSAVYKWEKDGITIPDADSATLILKGISPDNQGNYKCTVSNGFGSVTSNPAYLLVKLPPKIYTEPRETWITPGEEVLLKPAFGGSDPITYSWNKDDIPLPGETNPELYLIPADSLDEGMYSLELSNSCGTATTSPAPIWLAPQICMVTVSTTTGHNLVVWEKKTRAPIMAYNIYRESVAAGIYDRLATLSFDELSVFVDTTADPTVQAYLYKITAIDTGNVETDIDLCEPHKTIHLIVSTNPELNTTQLQWDKYYGFDYQTYTIYKSTTGLNFDPVHSLSASLNSWTDPEASTGDLFYRIAVEKPDPCVPEGGGKKAGTGPYVNSLSNMDDNKLKAGENPPDSIYLDNSSINENMLPGSLVGRFITIDPDTVDYYTYQFASGEGDVDNNSFSLIGDLLVSAESFDYETRSSYQVRIRTTDNAAFYLERALIITINDTGEGGTISGSTPPDSIMLDIRAIAENNLFGDPVGVLVTADTDSGDVHSYRLVSGSGDDDNLIFMITGEVLRAATIFDYEQKNQYSIRIRSTDLAGNHVDRVFIISITDVIETGGFDQKGIDALRVYPNPFTHSTTIAFPNHTGKEYKIQLTDLSGKLILNAVVTDERFILMRDDLERGMYLLEITGENDYRTRLMIE